MIFLFVSPTPMGTSMIYGSFLARLISMPLAPFRNYVDWLDVATVGIVALALAAGFWTRRFRVAREMRLPLAALALLCFVCLCAIASGGNAEIRLPVIAMLLLAASGEWIAPRRRELLFAGTALGLLLGVRTAATVDAFAQGDRFVAEMGGALAAIPRGARIGSMTVTTALQYRMRPEWAHSICYEVIDKSALVPSIFTYAGQAFAARAGLPGRGVPPVHYVSRPGQVLPASGFAQVDYVVVINPEALQTSLPPNLQLIVERDQFRVYRVRD